VPNLAASPRGTQLIDRTNLVSLDGEIAAGLFRGLTVEARHFRRNQDIHSRETGSHKHEVLSPERTRMNMNQQSRPDSPRLTL
jgi:hypothetical protein